jgi:hypothetical protein
MHILIWGSREGPRGQDREHILMPHDLCVWRWPLFFSKRH